MNYELSEDKQTLRVSKSTIDEVFTIRNRVETYEVGEPVHLCDEQGILIQDRVWWVKGFADDSLFGLRIHLADRRNGNANSIGLPYELVKLNAMLRLAVETL